MSIPVLQVVDQFGNPTPQYRRLKDPRDKYKWVAERYNIEKLKGEPDIALLQDLYSEALRQRAKATMLFPVWDATNNLSLFDLEGKKLLYAPNPVQQKIHAFAEMCRKAGIPLKLLLPKSRRHGVTEGVSKIIYPFIARRENVKALIVAQADPEAEEIFRDKYKYVHETDPFAPVAKRSNTTILDFADTGSQIAVRSAGGRKGVGRGSGHIAIHFSECAYYPGSARDVSSLISSLIAGMPKTNVLADGTIERVFSMVFAESTGNGQQGWFYEKCMRAHNKEQGRVEGEVGSDEDLVGWQIMFFPWFERWNAIMPFVYEDERRSLGQAKAAAVEMDRKRKFIESMDEEELLLKEEYGLTLEQLHWRRDTLLHDIEGTTEEERKRMFKQEHPATLIQCFQPAGGMAFPIDKVDALHQKAEDPSFVGKFVAPITMFDPATSARIPRTPLVKPISDPVSGWFYRLKEPNKGEEYCIGVDLAKGSIAGDWSTAAVFSRHRRQFVAYIRAKLSPDQMVEPVRLLSRYYNDAWINPEENYGAHLIEEMKKCDRRGRLYWRHAKRGSAGQQVERSYGFNTNRYTKKHLVDLTNAVLENEPGVFTIKQMLQEMLTFEQELTESGEVLYPGAPPNSGVWDDLLMAGMLALLCDHDMPPPGAPPPEEEPDADLTNEERRVFRRDIQGHLKAMTDERGYIRDDTSVELEEW